MKIAAENGLNGLQKLTSTYFYILTFDRSVSEELKTGCVLR